MLTVGPQTRVLVAGGGGVLGAPLVASLRQTGAQVVAVDRADGDLRDPTYARWLFQLTSFDAVFVVAGPTGSAAWQHVHGAELLRDNAGIASAVIAAAMDARTPHLVYAASAALYPEHAPQPHSESALFSGPFEVSHLDYAIGKAVGVLLCRAARENGLRYTAAVLTNLFGPGARLELERAHVIPALILRALRNDGPLRVHGDGAVLRDIMFGRDAADALVALVAEDHGFAAVNVASGLPVSIGDLAMMIAEKTNRPGVMFDIGTGAGVHQRRLDVSRQHGFFKPKLTPLSDALDETIADVRARIHAASI